MCETDRSTYNATTTRNSVFVANAVFLSSLCRKGNQRMIVLTAEEKGPTITGDLAELACWGSAVFGRRTVYSQSGSTTEGRRGSKTSDAVKVGSQPGKESVGDWIVMLIVLTSDGSRVM